jgi:O-antigen/teichoic acid export membrane protein
MRSWLQRRRLTTAAGVYGAAVLGVLATAAAARQLSPSEFGQFAIVLAALALFQLLMDLTVDEAVIKFGFRYSIGGRWGRLRTVFRNGLFAKLAGGLFGTLALLVLAPLSDRFWGPGLTVPLLVAAWVPVVQAPEGIAAAALVIRSRYDVRAGFLFLSMGLRVIGVAIGAHYGVVQAVAGLLAAQVLATAAISVAGFVALRGLPAAPREPLEEDRGDFWRFVAKSSAGSGLAAISGSISTLLVGAVSTTAEAGFFRIAQTPLAAFAALSSPVRLILLTEQTRDFERGDSARFWGLLKRYVVATGTVSALALPPLLLLMPFLVKLVFGPQAAPAGDAARLMLVAAALQLVWGWTKSFPVSIGRPQLRIAAHCVELVVLVPLLVVFASEWGATGAAGAVLCSTCAFCAFWTVMLLRVRRGPWPQPVAVQ